MHWFHWVVPGIAARPSCSEVATAGPLASTASVVACELKKFGGAKSLDTKASSEAHIFEIALRAAPRPGGKETVAARVVEGGGVKQRCAG